MRLEERVIHGSKMLLDSGDPGISSQLLEPSGSRELCAPYLVEEIVRPEWTVIDAGASIGFYALISAKAGARVYAIEPVPSNVQILEKCKRLNGYENMSVHPIAVGDADHPIEFDISKHRNSSTPTHKFATPIVAEYRTVLPCLTLDTFCEKHDIKRVDFLRHDVEGYEVEMYAGAKRMLTELMPPGSWIFGELHANRFDNPENEFKGAMQSLIDYGFVPRWIVHICTWDPPRLNHFCCPMDSKVSMYACELSGAPHTAYDHDYKGKPEDFPADIARNEIFLDGGQRHSQWAFLQKQG